MLCRMPRQKMGAVFIWIITVPTLLLAAYHTIDYTVNGSSRFERAEFPMVNYKLLKATENPDSQEKLRADHSRHIDGFRHHLSRFTNNELRQIASPWTMVSPDHFNLALDAVKKINEKGIPGDIVECGVWKGGMSMSMALINLRSNMQRRFWLFDTFEGLPEPDSEFDSKVAKHHYEDLKEGKNTSKILRSKINRGMEEGKWNYGPIDVVKNNMLYTTYPAEKINYVEGKVEHSLYSVELPEKIAILRLDTDWYNSTRAELEILFDRLQSGGILIVDDYCSWQGARTATDKFFEGKLGLSAADISKKAPCLHYWKP